MKNSILLIIAFWFIAQNAFAGVIQNGKITKMAIDNVTGEMVFIQVEGSKEGAPACHASSSWSFVLPLTSEIDTKIFSMLLAARASGANVRLQGNDQCDTYGTVESLKYFTY